jgi:hypothetical protein
MMMEQLDMLCLEYHSMENVTLLQRHRIPQMATVFPKLNIEMNI